MSDHFRIGSPYGAGELVQEVGVDLKDIEGVYISHMHVSRIFRACRSCKLTNPCSSTIGQWFPLDLSEILEKP